MQKHPTVSMLDHRFRMLIVALVAALVATGVAFANAGTAGAAQKVTASQIIADPVAFEGVDVELTGTIIRQIDDDDYILDDTTGEIRIDVLSDVPVPPLGVTITITGIYLDPEVNVYAWQSDGGGPGIPSEIVTATIGEIKSNPSGFDGKAVEVVGLVASQKDDDDFVFTDTTGEIDIDVQPGVPSPTVGSVIRVVGIYIDPEIKVFAWEAVGGGTVPPTGGPLPAKGRVCFEVAGAAGDVAFVNLTPVEAAAAGFGLLVSSDVAVPPVASNVNFVPGSVDPNLAAAPIGADGRVCFANNSAAAVHIIADHLGSVASSVYTAATTSGAPDRKIDTRGGAPVAPA